MQKKYMETDLILGAGGSIYGGYVRDSLAGIEPPSSPDYMLPPAACKHTNNDRPHALGELRGKYLAPDDGWYDRCDFTCNILKREATGLTMRFIPSCMESLADPFGTVLHHIENRILCPCGEYPMDFQDGLHVLEKMISMSTQGWMPGHESWPAMRIENDIVYTACGHEVSLREMYVHLLRGKGPLECPRCPENPVIKPTLPVGVYDADT